MPFMRANQRLSRLPSSPCIPTPLLQELRVIDTLNPQIYSSLRSEGSVRVGQGWLAWG